MESASDAFAVQNHTGPPVGEHPGLNPGPGLAHLLIEESGAPRQIIEVRDLSKEYATGRGKLVLFHNLNLTVAAGEMLAIVGPSGAGKSTLLHILGALDAASSGTVDCASTNVSSLSPKQAAVFRNREIGYVWQFHYLLPEFTALENVAMPLLARGDSRSLAIKAAEKWLQEVELSDRASHRAGELSGGEQQRVSLARALVTGPKVLLADEPTGDLDGRSADVIFSLIERLHRGHGLTSLIVTHNPSIARRCSRVLRLDKGRLESVTMNHFSDETADGSRVDSLPLH
ncbi:MAG TPA: ABC transporter ATP-binding protein [Acidisarcina sp.]